MKKWQLKKKQNPKKESRKKKDKKWILSFLMVGGIGILLIVIFFFAYIVITAPTFTTNKLYSKEASVLYDRNNNEIVRLGEENRALVSYNELPQVLVDALVATEDSRFFQHNGVDAARFLKASIGQLLGKDAGGASTLTMQLAKNVYNGTEAHGIKGIIRKFSDVYMAVFKIEKSYTKEEIIEFYVNSQELGVGRNNNYGNIYGVEQASQEYFGKSVKDLSLPEASLLVGMFNNPSLFNPLRFPENAKSRQKAVLSLMVRHGYITEEEADIAGNIPIDALLKTTTTEQKADDKGLQAFIDYVVKDVKEKTGDDPTKVPMAIYTTLDRDIQDVVTKLENGEIYKFRDDLIQNGVAITSTEDGSILALGPGRNYVYQSDNRSILRYYPGSTAKIIFDYGPLVEFNNVSDQELFIDEPYTYSNGTAIHNYDGRYKGLITLEDALIDSRNVPALQAFHKTTLEQKQDFSHSLGIDYGDTLFESDAIGGGFKASPLQMSAAYAAFGRGGYYIEPYSFTKIVYLENEKPYEYKYTKTRVMSEETAYIITSVLVQGGKENVAGNISVSGTEFAAKGGTTNITDDDAKKLGISTAATPDHWNIVYTTDYSIALWVGYDDLRLGHLTMNDGQIRRKMMVAMANRILKKNSKFSKPSGVVEVTVEDETIPLQLASDATPKSLRKTALFKSGTEPTTVSNRFEKLNNPTNGNSLVNGSSITLTWNGIATPDAINENYLQNYFNKNYFLEPKKYYNERINYNNKKIGTVGYQIYSKNTDGTLISLGWTDQTSFTYVASSAGQYEFVIKSAYSIFKDNMSDGITIIANLGDLQVPSTPETDPNENNNPTTEEPTTETLENGTI